MPKLATESAKAKRVSYTPRKGLWLTTNQNSGAEKISIFISTTEQILKSIV